MKRDFEADLAAMAAIAPKLSEFIFVYRASGLSDEEIYYKIKRVIDEVWQEREDAK